MNAMMKKGLLWGGIILASVFGEAEEVRTSTIAVITPNTVGYQAGDSRTVPTSIDGSGDTETILTEYTDRTDTADARSTDDPVNTLSNFEFGFAYSIDFDVENLYYYSVWFVTWPDELQGISELSSGTLTKPNGTPVVLKAGNRNPSRLELPVTGTEFGSLAAMQAAWPAGQHAAEITAETLERGTQVFHVDITVPDYDVGSFPIPPIVTYPANRVTDIPLGLTVQLYNLNSRFTLQLTDISSSNGNAVDIYAADLENGST